MPTTEEILAERGKTHGDFTDNARVMQRLKDAVHDEFHWEKLNPVQREAVEMILRKVGRIISNPNIHDHWDDIAGYAKLASDRIAKPDVTHAPGGITNIAANGRPIDRL